MFSDTYDGIKKHYERTKPIRGRSEDIRPAGDRRRDWERVVKTERGYAYQMRHIQCVEFTEDKLILRTNGWTTVGTGKFINDHSALVCGKRHNAIWLGIASLANSPDRRVAHTYNSEGRFLWVPIPKDGEVTFTLDKAAQRYVLDPVKIQVRTVNRKRANEARKRLKPLLNYATSMLRLSDGEVQRDMMRTGTSRRDFNLFPSTDEEIHASFISLLYQTNQVWSDWQRGVTKYRIASVQRTLYKLHDAQSPEIYDYEWIDPSHQMPTNHVGYT